MLIGQELKPCELTRDMGGGRGEEMRGRREQEEGERWDPSEGVEAHGPGIAIRRHKGEEKGDKRCADEWKGGKEPDEEGAAAWVDWQSDSDLIRREGDEENVNAIWMNAMEYPALRACMRSEMVEGEGVRLEDGKILRMEKGKAEMDKVTGVKAAYIRKTRQVLNLIIPGTEKEGVTHVYATDASAGEKGVGAAVWKGMGREDDEEEAVRSGVKGCTCPKDWDNDDGELFAITWAVALAYEDDKAAVPMILSDSWSMIQAAETAWKKGGAHEGERKARAMLLETLNWYRKRMKVILVYVPSHVGVVMNTWADAIADLYAEGEPDHERIWETVTGRVKTRKVAYKGSEGDTLMGKPYNEAKKRVRKWVLADLDREGMQRPQLEKTWARLAMEGAGKKYRDMGKETVGGWGAATNKRTEVAMAMRWGDHKDVPQGRKWRGMYAAERRRDTPGNAAWTRMCGCPCGRGRETGGGDPDNVAERKEKKMDRTMSGMRRVESWKICERAGKRWKNTYALLSETTADVRHMHTGECSMVHNRKSRVEALRGAIEEVGKTIREVCGDEEEDEDAEDGRGRYEEDRWYYEVEGVCRGNVLEKETEFTMEVRKVGPVRRLMKGDSLMVRGGMTLEEAKRRMGAGAEAETGMQWWVGNVVYMVVDTQRATESSAAARADRIRKTDSLSMGRVKRTGKRSMKRAMHEPAVRASRSVIEFGEPAVRELSGWANEWMAEVDKAEDAMDRIKRGRKAKGEEYEGLRKILGAEMMEPKGVGKKGRRSLVVAIGKAQLAAASVGEGWKTGTGARMKRDKEVGEHRETLKTIMRAWLGYSQDRPGWKEWGRCKCETKWCTCKHVVIGTGHRNALGMDKSMEMGEWWEREERNRDVEKGMRGDEMANGDKE